MQHRFIKMFVSIILVMFCKTKYWRSLKVDIKFNKYFITYITFSTATYIHGKISLLIKLLSWYVDCLLRWTFALVYMFNNEIHKKNWFITFKMLLEHISWIKIYMMTYLNSNNTVFCPIFCVSVFAVSKEVVVDWIIMIIRHIRAK